MASAPGNRKRMSHHAQNELPAEGRSSKAAYLNPQRRYSVPAGDSFDKNEETELQILIIGKTGNGKSSVGNKILGRPQFTVASGILSATTHTQLAVSDKKYKGRNLKMQVIDFPDVADCDLESAERKRQIDLCRTLTYPYPTAVCLVVRADVRFTPEEYANYLETKEVLGDRIKENLVVVFTMADKLPPDLRDNFNRELQQTNQQLQHIVEEANHRHVLLSNMPGSQVEDEALSQLSDMFLRLHHKRRSESKLIRAVLLGAAGSGKSATGNSLGLGKRIFEENENMGRGHPCVQKAINLRDFKLQVLDTSGLSYSSRPKDTTGCLKAVHEWITSVPQDVIIYVIKASVPFYEQDLKVLDDLQTLAENPGEVYRRLIVVFGGGDTMNQSLDTFLNQSPISLVHLQKKVESRCLVFNNNHNGQQNNVQDMVLQRNRLLEMMDSIARAHHRKPLKLQPQAQQTGPEHACGSTTRTADARTVGQPKAERQPVTVGQAKTAGQPVTVGQAKTAGRPQPQSQGHTEDRQQRAPQHKSWMKCAVL